DPDDPPPPWAIALSRQGRVLRFPLAPHEDISNRTGRRYARVADKDEVLAVWPCDGSERVAVATTGGRAMLFPVAEVPLLKAAGRGVTGIKTRDDDRVLAFELARGALDGPAVVTGQGREMVVRERKFG